MMKATSSGRAPDLGMDHRAIVWCHNLLLSMRTVIFTLVQTDRQHLSATDRVDAVRESLSVDSNYDFLSSAGQLRIAFRVRWMHKPRDSNRIDSTQLECDSLASALSPSLVSSTLEVIRHIASNSHGVGSTIQCRAIDYFIRLHWGLALHRCKYIVGSCSVNATARIDDRPLPAVY